MFESVRMPGIGSSVTGLWVAGNHLFLSYLTETKCLDLESYSEVSVEGFNFVPMSSLYVAMHGGCFWQVTGLEVRSTDMVLAFPQHATAAKILNGAVYACLTSLQLYRSPLNSSSDSTLWDLEAEVTALYVNQHHIYAGLATNKLVIIGETLQKGLKLMEIDLNVVSNATIPNDIVEGMGGERQREVYVGMREGNMVILTSKGEIKETAVIGSEPIHFCPLSPTKVLAASTCAYLYEETPSGKLRKLQVALKNTRLICPINDKFVAVTSDLSIASIAQKLDYHMTFETLKKCSNTAKRVLFLGPFTLVLLGNGNYWVEINDSVRIM